MSDYVYTLMVRQHQKEIRQEFAAQHLASLAMGDQSRRRWNLRRLTRSFHMVMVNVGRGMALRGLWMSSKKTQLTPVVAEGETLVPDCC